MGFFKKGLICLVLLISTLTLFRRIKQGHELGEIQQSMVGMLGDELPFTSFVPGEIYLEKILRGNGSSSEDKAILTRLLAFGSIPVRLLSTSLPEGHQVEAVSVSGYKLYITKDKGLVVNGMACEPVDVKRGKVVIHIVKGIIMDLEFTNSLRHQLSRD